MTIWLLTLFITTAPVGHTYTENHEFRGQFACEQALTQYRHQTGITRTVDGVCVDTGRE